MTQIEIRPAANGTDTQPITSSNNSDQSKACTQRGGNDCRRWACKVCVSLYKRQWYEKNRDTVLVQQRQYRASNMGVVWARRHRRRAAQYGLDLITELITPEDVIRRWGDRCVYCPTGAFEELDHIIPVRAGGHHQLRNVVPCCRACNIKKRWANDELWFRRLRTGRVQDAHSGPSEPPSQS